MNKPITGANIVELRPSVWAFAQAMEVELRKSDWKDGWQDMGSFEVLDRIREEVDELEVVIGIGHKGEEVLKESVDPANFCMFMADVHGMLPPILGNPSSDNLRRLELHPEIATILERIINNPEGTYSRDPVQYRDNVIAWITSELEGLLSRIQSTNHRQG